jgi:hypothetical protein
MMRSKGKSTGGSDGGYVIWVDEMLDTHARITKKIRSFYKLPTLSLIFKLNLYIIKYKFA